MKRSTSIYVYKLTSDNGGAPCVYRRLLSLAICKPKIRSAAKEGDLIVGFGAKRYGERLIYAAVVTAKLPAGQYYRDKRYNRRPDCIYRDVHGKASMRIRPAPRFHSEGKQLRKDVGKHFENANVLLSDDFRYLGRDGTDDYKQSFPAIKKLVEGLRRGHRVNYSPVTHSEFIHLKEKLWSESRKDRIGPPSDDDIRRACNQSAGSRQVHC